LWEDGGGAEDGKEWKRRGRKSSWEEEQWIAVQEKEGELYWLYLDA
jgi:hypothetical protein